MSGLVLRERLALLEELQQIVQAMKNMAFAELQRLAPLHAAHAEAIAMLQSAWRQVGSAAQPGRRVRWLVIGSERGFCGAFNAHLVEAVRTLQREDPAAQLRVAGRRLADALEGAVPALHRLPGCAGSDDLRATVAQWLRALVDDIAGGAALYVLHATRDGLQRRQLLPLPLPAAIQERQPAVVPHRYLAVAEIRLALMRQAVEFGLLQAAAQSLDEENHWRLNQMQAAQDHLESRRLSLRRRIALQAQSRITNELETLMTAVDGVQPGAGMNGQAPAQSVSAPA